MDGKASGFSAARKTAVHPRFWPAVAVLAGAMTVLAVLGSCSCPQEEGALELGAQGIASGFAAAFENAFEEDEPSAAAEVGSKGVMDAYSASVPEAAKVEGVSPEGALCSVSSGGVTLGFSRNQDVGDSLAWISDQMQRKGWAVVPSGSSVAATFAKGSGTYRWAAATCTEAGGATSVVLSMSEVGSNGK
jgi:hypothetical protein